MDNPFDETRRATARAEAQLRAADEVAFDMARLLRNRLRKVRCASTLAALKRELRDFNIHTGRWRE